MRIIDDRTPLDTLLTGEYGTGWTPPKGFAGPESYEGMQAARAEAFPESLMMDESALRAKIEELEARQATHMVVARDNGLKSKNQKRTNYCWMNSPVYCMEYMRVLQGLVHVPLSPASAAGPIKNFRNNGGWGREAMEWLGDRGVTPTEFWPDNAIDSSLYTAENRQRALSYRQTEWWVFRQRDLRAVASCVVGLGIPVSVGLNWWGHQVTYVHFRFRNGLLVPVFRNSYGDEWEEDGYAELEGSRALPDDACAMRVALAS